MFRRILTTIDLKETCPQVVEEAIAFASCLDSKLMLLHVISTEEELYLPYSLYPVMDGYSGFSETALGQYEERVKAYEDECRAKLETYQNQARQKGVDAEIRLVTGETGHAICDAVKDWKGDLVLLGNRGLRGIKEMVLGSVSNFVMHHAPCSVLVLRARQTQDLENQSFNGRELSPQR